MEILKINKKIIEQKKVKEVSAIYKSIFLKTFLKTSTGMLAFLNKGKHVDVYI